MKKYEFWAYGGVNILLWPTYFSGSMIIIIIGISLNNEASIYPIMVGVILDIIYILIILFHPKVLAKIVFTPESVTIKRFGKILITIKWEDVIEIDEFRLARADKIAYIESANAKIEIFPTRKAYNAIMDVCPYESFKHIFNELEAFKWYHRKKKNKKTGD